MENTGAVVFMEDLLSDNADYEYRHFDDVISHELAHHWFGNLVTCESWANLPLNESLASYAEQIWNEYYYGQDSADLIAFFELNDYLEESVKKKADLIRYYYDNPDTDLFDRHSYSKGSRIIHMLRLYVGDDAFFASLKYYLSQHQFSNVEVHDLRLAFEKVTGMDLNWFFTQWFLNPGHPELEVVHRSEDDTLYIEVDQVQDLSVYPLYQLPVYVDINWGSEQLSYPLMIQNQRHVFKIPALGRKPQSIIFDSDYQLVGTVSHQKSVAELIHQIQNSDQIIGRYEAYLKLINEEQDEVAISKAIDLALQERHPMLLSLLLDQISLLNEDLVIAHRDKIIDLISHSSLHVRGSALYLASYFFADKINWTEFLGESNNYIKGIALENLCLNSDDQTKRNLFDEFKESSSPDIILPLSYVINDIFKKGYSNWYQAKIMETLASEQLYILSAYNEYLLNAPQIELLQSREFIMRYAKFHENRETRFVAFEGLVILSEKLDMSRFIEEVIAFEQDEQLLDIYQKILPR